MSFPELAFLENLLEELKHRARIEQLASIKYFTETFPIYGISIGSQQPEAPTLALVGGVHGQEKIGSQVVLSFLETLTELLHWDEMTNVYLEKLRIVLVPIVNPVGMFLLRRGNGNRVDLNRNSPVDADSHSYPVVGGQRFTPYLPWYRGPRGGPMEVESQALCDFIRREVFPSRAAIALDCHSGYGAVDRLWFPYSYTFQPFPDIAQAFALKNLLDNTYPNHVYVMEPGAQGYTISGDIWDFLYKEHREQTQGQRRFLPITLEMGSWLWLKKNPVQLFSAIGLFHPAQLHRHKRILRRHIPLLDFLQRAVISSDRWAFLTEAEQEVLRKGAMEEWYSFE
jgi:Zinc carboxypeptidase